MTFWSAEKRIFSGVDGLAELLLAQLQLEPTALGDRDFVTAVEHEVGDALLARHFAGQIEELLVAAVVKKSSLMWRSGLGKTKVLPVASPRR